ncbi:MAG: GSCFA domain-containing protein [Saprospiraceae bacterium]
MLFRTELNILPSKAQIQYTDPVLLIGSCFSQNIGSYLQKYKFNVISNPFGTVFNPISIAKLLQVAALDTQFTAEDLLKSQGKWVHPDFHSVLSTTNVKSTLDQIHQAIHHVHLALKRVKIIFITLGTSYAYTFKESETVVANCHKLSGNLFDKKLLSVEESVAALEESIALLRRSNDSIHVVVTVSPVRHIKDGIVENQRSKARLIETAHRLVELDPENTTYFPAYEWLMDDLRDYRFYGEDMIHPSDSAIQFIWEKFCHHYFEKDTLSKLSEVQDILKAAHHKHFNPDSAETAKFKSEYLRKIDALTGRFPFLNFDTEKTAFQ